jgi:hypothetical protein
MASALNISVPAFKTFWQRDGLPFLAGSLCLTFAFGLQIVSSVDLMSCFNSEKRFHTMIVLKLIVLLRALSSTVLFAFKLGPGGRSQCTTVKTLIQFDN